MLLSAKGRAYKLLVAQKGRAQGAVIMAGALRVEADLYRPRRVGDIDGPLKALLDALAGVAYENDKSVRQLWVRLLDDKLDPRVEVTITKVGT